jgi:Fe-S-cluster containining protein
MPKRRAANDERRIFLTRREAVRAIHIDFEQYDPQIEIWRKICPMVLGSDVRLVEDFTARRMWLAVGRNRRMKPVKAKDLGAILIRALEKSDAPLNDLALICMQVFQTNVHAGHSEDGRKKGLYVETGMEDFVCKKCGRCCRTLDYHDQFTEQDYHHMERLGREDLLAWVRVISKKSPSSLYRIWVPPGRFSASPTCPWLQPVEGKAQWECSIHDVKPDICRQYPGSRKHAMMTGCPGFD